MHSYVEVIGPGTPDASSSLHLFFDEGRYLFECGDGTQRLCTEYGIKLGRLRSIFLTSLAAPSIGGLLGLNLTLADAGKESVSITAPKGLASIFKAARSFYYRPSLQSTLHEVDLEASVEPLPVLVLEDENVNITAIPVRSRRDIEIDTAFGAHFDALAYVCRLHDLRGKFNPARAMELGVKKGRLFGQLQRGVPVTTDNGVTVTPEQVMSKSTPGPMFLVIPCPTVNHIQAITKSKALNPVELGILSADASSNLMRRCVVAHLAPKHVLENTAYREWCDSFGADVSHIPLHPSVSSPRTVFSTHATDAALLHFTVDKDLFPLPSDALDASSLVSVSEARSSRSNPESAMPLSMCKPAQPEGFRTDEGFPSFCLNRTGTWLEGDCKMKFVLSPSANAGPDMGAVRPRFIERIAGQPKHPWREAALKKHAEEPVGKGRQTPPSISSLSPGTAAVRFFGTGAAIPGKHRNVSSLMIDMFERGSVMMDCGEGTWGQMVRMFGQERARRVLCGLKVVFISHMHADHHLGLLTLLHERAIALREQSVYGRGPQLVVVGPHYLASWLEAFQAAARVPLRDTLAPLKRSFKFFDAKALTDPQAPEAKFFPDAFGLEVGCVSVIHCPLSYGIMLRDCVSGWKVVYSGDTRPCPALGEIGKGATLAIHEATLSDDMQDEARDKLHCTTSEALDVCVNDMGAWRTILTHFSQRYPRIPKLDDATVARLDQDRAAFAFDLMSVDFTRLEEIPEVVPAMLDLFPDGNGVEASDIDEARARMHKACESV
ncbi:unnamed protein product [Chondrus crispus]|uniref:ribonuclease Z n=1 Tax=Chondrus crispus TaxID=2769 RepID=R7QHD9_CHOCR|nr:unnamed protein product [Chondrus crispus]CDF36881.1 unnamed protein product [Chondrus crispus]|eukprot:XP_005716700.1 unnamed protein product [Chondrus crispus]